MAQFLKVAAVFIWALALAAPATAGTTCDKTFTEIFRETSPSVVQIFSVAIDPFSLTDRVQLGTGSGIVIDDDGNILTNAHVVHGTSETLVSTGEIAMREAKVIGADPVSDLAVIRLTDQEISLPKASFGNSDEIEIGDEVLAVGFPFGMGTTATRGIVSGLGKVVPFSTMSWLTPFLQTDAAINPGNSGGPLVNRCGEVIGVNTLSAAKGQNFNFALPVNLVLELIPQLVEQGRVIRAWHGIHGRLVPPQLQFTLGTVPGFLVETIEPGSPAEKIGLLGGSLPIVIGVDEFLLGGDVITKVNGENMVDMETVVRVVRDFKVGDSVNLEYWRDGEMHEAEVVLPERPVLPGDVRKFRERRRFR
jgi:S1-C subfamily serine protease